MNNLKGAEAVIEVHTFYGKNVIIKTRLEKKYRVKILDEKLRYSRTRREARILLKLNKLDINVPKLIAVGKYSLMMSFIDGTLMRDLPENIELIGDIGKEVKKMHISGIVHGDLTPANIIIKENSPFIIDFGLAEVSNSLEEKAIDLLLFKRSVSKKAFELFLEGYVEKNHESKKILDKLKEVELRGRYNLRTLA
ncbi:MAG: KEOPS complex kinase/ATPase Bud32 [Candidatus Micrarchaeaceae archaeon]